jgi:hypothetical protein
MRPLSDEQVERNSNPSVAFPKNLVQIGYVTDALGYGVNDFVSRGAVPVFWPADVRVAHGLSLNYQRNVFHTRRVFALDWGAGLSSWKSKNGEPFSTASIYPVLPLHAASFEIAGYSISIIPSPGRPLFPRPRLTLMKTANSSPSRISWAWERLWAELDI